MRLGPYQSHMFPSKIEDVTLHYVGVGWVLVTKIVGIVLFSTSEPHAVTKPTNCPVTSLSQTHQDTVVFTLQKIGGQILPERLAKWFE